MSAPERSSLAMIRSSRVTSSASVILLVWIWKMRFLVFSSGRGNSIFLSMRPVGTRGFQSQPWCPGAWLREALPPHMSHLSHSVLCQILKKKCLGAKNVRLYRVHNPTYSYLKGTQFGKLLQASRQYLPLYISPVNPSSPKRPLETQNHGSAFTPHDGAHAA